MITNNKKYRIKWIHFNYTTNNQGKWSKKKYKQSHTQCNIYNLETDELISVGQSFLSSEDRNYCKAIGRYYATKRAMVGFEPSDQVDILSSLQMLPSHIRWTKQQINEENSIKERK